MNLNTQVKRVLTVAQSDLLIYSKLKHTQVKRVFTTSTQKVKIVEITAIQSIITKTGNNCEQLCANGKNHQ